MRDEKPASSCRRGFLFDLDGVLIDSEQTYTRIWAHIDSLYPSGVDNLPLVIKGTTLSDILATYFPRHVEEVRRLLHNMEAEMVYNYCPGAESLLRRLRERGIPCALVTSSDHVKMARLYAQHPEIRDYLPTVIDGSMVNRSKPDPEGYLRAAEAIGVAPEHCVVVEDAAQGARAGRSAGAYVVGVAGTLPASALEPIAHEIVDSLEEIDLDRLVGAN